MTTMLGTDQNGATKITVKKADLLAKVAANRAKHIDDVRAAREKYRAAVVAEAEAILAGPIDLTDLRALSEPVDHTKDYDRIIAMLEMSTASEWVVSEGEFSKYALDEWHWSGDIAETVAMYGNSLRKRR